MKKLLMLALICSVLSGFLFGCGGGGGTGGDIAAIATSAPVLSNLSYSPKSALVGSGTFVFSGSISFTSDADIVELHATKDGVEAIHSLSAPGRRSGAINISGSAATDTVKTYTLTLWVVDSLGRSSNILEGSVVVTAPAPVAKAGADSVVTTGAYTQLDGSSSINYAKSNTTYEWSLLQKPTSSNVTLTGATTSNPSFVPDVNGVYQLQLTINDGYKSSLPATMEVTSIPSGYITIGSSKEDVSRIQGTPTSINVYSGLGETDYHYGYSTIIISNSTGNVIEWNNASNNLKVVMVPGNNITSAARIKIGSSTDDVIKIQGTPTSINVYSGLGETDYHYGYSTIIISNSTGNVIEWNNASNNLILQM